MASTSRIFGNRHEVVTVISRRHLVSIAAIAPKKSGLEELHEVIATLEIND